MAAEQNIDCPLVVTKNIFTGLPGTLLLSNIVVLFGTPFIITDSETVL